MATDFKKKFEDLEISIQKLLSSHQQLKSENTRLMDMVTKSETTIREEKLKIKRLEEGFKELKQQERNQRTRSIETIKLKISNLVSEIDKNVSLINAKK